MRHVVVGPGVGGSGKEQDEARGGGPGAEGRWEGTG
jgi:hypothetical protein